MKNWLRYVVGYWDYPSGMSTIAVVSAPGVVQTVPDQNSLPVWKETGWVFIDPASVTSVLQFDDLKQKHATIYTNGSNGGFSVKSHTAEEIIADIQSALS